MSMYFDRCVKDQSLVVLFGIAFGSGTLLTAVLILCLQKQCRRVVEWLLFQPSAGVYEFVSVRQLNTNPPNSRLSRPSKQMKYMQDLFDLNDETVKHIDLKDLIEENPKRDPGLPPFDFEEDEKDEKELEKIRCKIRKFEKQDSKLKLVNKARPAEAKLQHRQSRPNQTEAKSNYTEIKATHKQRDEPNAAERQGKMLPSKLLSTSKMDGAKLKILSRPFPEANLKLRPTPKTAIHLKMNKRF